MRQTVAVAKERARALLEPLRGLGFVRRPDWTPGQRYRVRFGSLFSAGTDGRYGVNSGCAYGQVQQLGGEVLWWWKEDEGEEADEEEKNTGGKRRRLSRVPLMGDATKCKRL